VSPVSTISEVRKKLVEQQREMGKGQGIVMDGRDIGTVVFPKADLKIFMTASPEIRAQRRYDELVKRGDPISYEEVLENVTERDRIDSTREDSPLRKADDAIVIDNTETNLEDQFHMLLQLAKDRIAGRV
jgi:cytidylate kinase